MNYQAMWFLRSSVVVVPLSMVIASGIFQVKGAEGDLPEGKGSDVVARMCGSSCHQIHEVTQLRVSEDRWWQIVDEMVARGAIGSDEDVETVVYYLTSHFGVLVNLNQATAEEIETRLYLSAEDAARILGYRQANGNFEDWDDLKKVPGLDLKVLEEVKSNITF